jgi:hypothetical protein
MKILKNYIFRRRYVSALKKGDYEQRFVTYDNAKTVFLLFEFDAERYASFISIIESLERDGKKVVAWAYCSVKVEKTLDRQNFPKLSIFSKKSLNYSEKLQTETLNKLQKHSFDLLIDLSLQPLLPLMYAVLYAKVGCKTGIKKTDYSLFNFMIDINTSTDDDEQSVFNQIIFYLKSIQTTD